MNKNSKLRFKGENKREQFKSPRVSNPHPKDSLQPSISSITSDFKTYMRTYRKQVQLPIFYETSIFMSKAPQRCISHNKVITMFCQNDQKSLCAHCTHQALAHRNHEVLPISKANDTLKRSLEGTLQNLETLVLPGFTDLLKKIKVNLQRVELEMGSLTISVTKLYNDLSKFIETKKNEHLKYYQYLWNKLKLEYKAIASEMSKESQYFRDRIKEIAERKDEEHILLNFNIASHLGKVQGLHAPLAEYHSLETVNMVCKIDQIVKQIHSIFNFDYKGRTEKTSIDRGSPQARRDSKMAEWRDKVPGLMNEWSTHNLHRPNRNSPLEFHHEAVKAPMTPRQHPRKISLDKFDRFRSKVDSPPRNFPTERGKKIEPWLSDKRKGQKVLILVEKQT